MKKQCYDQVRELVSQYGKIDILWYDGAWLAHKDHDPDAAWLWEPVELNQMAREYNPKLLINPRSGWEGISIVTKVPIRSRATSSPYPGRSAFV